MPSDSVVYKPTLGTAKPIVRPENTYEACNSKLSEHEDSDEVDEEEEDEDEDNKDYGKLVTPPIPMSKLRMPAFPKSPGVDLLAELDAAAAPPDVRIFESFDHGRQPLGSTSGDATVFNEA